MFFQRYTFHFLGNNNFMWANQKPFHQMLVVEWVCSIIGGIKNLTHWLYCYGSFSDISILMISDIIYIYPHFISFYQRTCSKEFQHFFPNVSQSAPMIPPEFSNVFPNLLIFSPDLNFCSFQIFSPDGSPNPQKSPNVSPRPFGATMPLGTGCWTWLSWPARWRREPKAMVM